MISRLLLTLQAFSSRVSPLIRRLDGWWVMRTTRGTWLHGVWGWGMALPVTNVLTV